jgi:transposase InsO family protein
MVSLEFRLERKKLGIRCVQKKKYKATTDSRHTLPVVENLLKQNFGTIAPDQVWVSDITYIPTDEGWLYLTGHKDLFTGEVVGYAMAERMTRRLVSQSLFRAVSNELPRSRAARYQRCHSGLSGIFLCFAILLCITYAPEGFPTSGNDRIRRTVTPKLSFEEFF